MLIYIYKYIFNISVYRWGTHDLKDYLRRKGINKDIILKLVSGKITGRMVPMLINLNNYKLESITGVSDDTLDVVRKELINMLFADVSGKL